MRRQRAQTQAVPQSQCSCDYAKVPGDVLTVLSDIEDGASCVFSDILDRLPPRLRKALGDLPPNDGDDLHIRAEQYAKMKIFILENIADLFPADAASYCFVHKRRCSARVHRAPLLEGLSPPLIIKCSSTVCKGFSRAGLRAKSCDPNEKARASDSPPSQLEGSHNIQWR